ncbi:MAG TPA: fused MFS/spermidine synthase, partial [Terriglobales bacterium]|nr:fused MFS/spermidine synthase [Terriglobales bacterium]
MPRVTILYSTAIFLGAFLLFLIEPIAAKRLLPLLGGSSAVWITCLVFFQSALLLGYTGAHWLATRIRPRAQSLIYSVLLLAALAQSAFGLNSELRASTFHPAVSVFVLLGTLIGVPFIVLSSTNPLLQAWYVREIAAARGRYPMPYRLFALSNFGSLLALVLYPWLVEPRFPLHAQSTVWLAGFIVFALAGLSLAWRSRNGLHHASLSNETSADPSLAAPATSARVLWFLLPAAASLLLCAVTNYLSQNIAAIPLLWILPLTAYLVSFIWAFAGARLYPRRLMQFVLLIVLGAVAFDVSSGFGFWSKQLTLPIQWAIVLYCSALLLVCFVCHAELYRLRPGPRYATSFYLSLSAGGALGAILVGVIAPLVFRGNYELAWGLAAAAVVIFAATWNLGYLWRGLWVAGAGLMIVLAVLQMRYIGRDTIAQVRNFYGALRVTQDMEPPEVVFSRTLIHGTIQHGKQVFNDELRKTPTTYYAHNSGVGLALDLCCRDKPKRVGVIGLGTGTLAAYGRPGDVFRFYDINPLVPTLAKNLFTYLRESAAKTEIVMGDARLSLAAEPPQNYDVLVIDAFSGDAIPVHLITAEAVALYRRHLKPNG